LKQRQNPAQLTGNFGLNLAGIILSLGDEGKDPDWLKHAALQIMRATMPGKS
jgi:hypothetical protein